MPTVRCYAPDHWSQWTKQHPTNYSIAHHGNPSNYRTGHWGAPMQSWSAHAGGFFTVVRGGIYFDTSALAAADQILSATLYVSKILTDAQDGDIVVLNAPSINDPGDVNDWDYLAGLGLSVEAARFTAAHYPAGYYTVNLTIVGLSNIQRGGLTRFATRMLDDILSNAPPVGPAYEQNGSLLAAYPSWDCWLDIVYSFPSVPACTTNPATGIADTAATLNGFLDDDGGEGPLPFPCDCGFEWGETTALGNTTSTTSHNTGEAITHLLVSLDPCKTYYFRTFGTNPIGTCYGAIMSFKTIGCPVTEGSVQTLPVTRVSENAARLNGLVADSLGRHMSVAFEYGLTTDYGMKTGWQQAFITGDEFRADIRNLGEGQSYHCRAMMTGSGIVYGSDVAFKTPVGTGPVTMVEHELLDLLNVR